MNVQTIILERPGELRLGASEVPDAPGPGEALVRVGRVGICGTDIHAYHGRQPFFSYPRILGHELGVEVAALGPDTSGPPVGARCAVEPYLNCGACVACRRGRTNCCVRLETLGVHTDGGMRPYIVVPAAKLHRAERLSLEQLALVETLAIGAHAAGRAGLEAGEWALVIGAGPIGLATMQFARLAGARVIAIDVSERRLDLCRALGAADERIVAGPEALAQVEALTGGDLPTAVFDATGNAQSMMQAFQYAAHGGRLVFVGLVQGDITFSDPFLHRRELTLLASRNAVAGDFRRIIALIEEGALDTGPWITHRAGMAELVARFPSWLRPEAGLLKGMLVME
jgi:2-desacetyl-2-hydroxyethyl bacteriochlorophyllide A dehydrogenase